MDLFLLFVIVSAIWVGFDAQGRDWSHSGFARTATGWFFGTLLLWLIYFPAYLAKRSRAPRIP